MKKHCSDPKFHDVHKLARDAPLPTLVLEKEKPLTSPGMHKELSKTKPKKGQEKRS